MNGASASDARPEGPVYVTVDEAATTLRSEMEAQGYHGGVNTIKSWVMRGQIQRMRRGRRLVVALDDVRAYIRANGQAGDVRPW